MRTRSLAVILAAAIGFVTLYAQQQPSTVPFSKKGRLHDVATPGQLGGLRTQPLPRVAIAPTGRNLPLPQTWLVDPATGAQYRAG